MSKFKDRSKWFIFLFYSFAYLLDICVTLFKIVTVLKTDAETKFLPGISDTSKTFSFGCVLIIFSDLMTLAYDVSL